MYIYIVSGPRNSTDDIGERGSHCIQNKILNWEFEWKRIIKNLLVNSTIDLKKSQELTSGLVWQTKSDVLIIWFPL